MSAIFGIVRRDGAPIGDSALATMCDASAEWGRDGFATWSELDAGLGQARTFAVPESRFEALPVFDATRGFAFTAAGRLDNREALLVALAPHDPRRADGVVCDGDLLLAAYRRWGEDAPAHLLGDWSLAAWHPAQRRLFLARDHFGCTALYYYADERSFAFASSQRALLALGLAPIEVDELYLAQYLTSWPAYHGERAASSPLRRLPPAHALTLTPERLDVRCYWRMEDVDELRLSRRSDYVGAFRELFDHAVRARLRSCGPVGAELSGGLDSSSVAATAALQLGRLDAFTAAPRAATEPYLRRRFGDELPFARATAAYAGNIELHPIFAEQLSPIEAIRRALDICGAPVHAAANMFWQLELLDAARSVGCRVLLTGRMGNATVSWYGRPLSQPLTYQLAQLGARGSARARLRQAAPGALLARARRRALAPDWYRSSAIHPAFARRLNIAERRLDDPDEHPRTPLEERLSILQPGRSLLGAISAETGAAFGQEVRDPTGDPRIVEFCLSVPDSVFIDPASGLDRWLIREAMRDRLPDRVRLNRRAGQQAADLVPRLRACREEVEIALDELADGPAAAYVDVGHMRDAWQVIQHDETPDSFRQAVSVLTRGIMGGLHVNAVAGAGREALVRS